MRGEHHTESQINDAIMHGVLERIRAGDQTALDTLYTTYARTLVSIAAFQTQSVSVAEEVVQDVFLRLWTQRATIRIDGDMLVYLASAVRNRARDWVKHRRIIERVEHTVLAGGAKLPAFGEPTPSADALTEANEFSEAYAQALKALTERERVAFLLRWDEGLPFGAIGTVLGLSDVGVRKLVLRAQAKLRALLAAHGD